MPLTIWLVIAFAFHVAITTASDFSSSVESSVLTLADAAKHDGYYLDSLNDVAPAAGPETLQCPSDNVITTRYKCNVNDEWVDCTRKHCCPDYIFIANKCISKDQDPCLMNLCEQRCTVYLQRVICTCFDGYKFNPDHQRKAIKPVCVDVNECEDKNGDCQHECINEIGSYRCECSPGFVLRADNRTCDADTEAAIPGDVQAATRDHCFANCDTVQRLHEKVKVLQEKILALSTAVHMSSFASGPPGPPGAVGPVGPRGFPGVDGTTVGRTTAGRDVTSPEDYTYSMLDAFVPLPADGHHQASFCRCKRGAIGPSGSAGAEGRKGEPGERGQRGPKGDKGSLDFVLLLLADLRHDVMHLQNKVYKTDETPPHFDLNQALKKHRIKERQQQKRQNRLLQGYAAPAIERAVSAATSEVVSAENSQESVSAEQSLLDRESKNGELSFTTAGIDRAEEQSFTSRTTSSPKPAQEEDDAIFIADYVDYEGSSYEDSYENYS